LYVCYADSLALKNHLFFRDALLNDRQLVEEYAQLKQFLLEETGLTREAYTIRKTNFILAVLAEKGFDEAELAAIRKANE